MDTKGIQTTAGAREWLASASVDCTDWSDADVALVMDALQKPVADFLSWDGADEFVASLGTEARS